MLSILLESAPARRGILPSLVAALISATAAWLSQGLLVWSGEGTSRLALLPVSPLSIAICAAAAAVVFLLVRRGASTIPLALLVLIAIPWIPGNLPPALMLWSGRLVILIWIAFAGAMLCDVRPRLPWSGARPAHRSAAVLSFALALLAWWQVSAQVPGGDEPHYLVITQSLLKDADVRIENNHRRGDYRTYFAGELQPDFRVRGQNGEIYSIHAPGVSALVAPAFLTGGYPGAVLFLVILMSLGSALAWRLAFEVTKRHDAAWFGWAAVTLSPTWIFHSFTIYPDGPGAVFLLTGVWALFRLDRETAEHTRSVGPWFWHGAALAVLPWLHTRFAVLAAGIAALVLLRIARVPNAGAKAIAFLVLPVASCFAWISYFISIYGTADPAAPYGGEEGSLGFVTDGLFGLLFDQRFGLIAYAPVLMFAFVGIGIMLAHPRLRRHGVELLFVAAPYLIVVTYVAMWWGGHSAPARFFVPLLPWLAIPAAVAWVSLGRRYARVTAIGSLVFTAFATCVLVLAGDGALAFNVRDAPAQWLEWLNGTVDLAHALPAWSREIHGPLYREVIVWMCAAAGAWMVLRALDQQRTVLTSAKRVVAATFAFAIAAAMAVSVSWAFEGTSGRLTTPSQLEALRWFASEPLLLTLRLSPPARLDRRSAVESLSIIPPLASAPGGAGRYDRPLFSLPAMPAGEYRLRPVLSRPDGWIMIGIGRDQFAIQTVSLAEAQAGLTVRFPVAVRALIVRGDEDARRYVRGIHVQAADVIPPRDHVAEGYARHAVRYAQTATFFMDDHSYPEPEAFWVKGEGTTEIVVQTDAARDTEEFLLRNGAAQNTVLVTAGGWRRELKLQPGEEHRLALPLATGGAATAIRFTTSAGFVPSAVDRQSRDNRYLGLWVKVGG